MTARTSASPIKLCVGTPLANFVTFSATDSHEYPGALPEEQVNQHDRENGDEAKLDAFPQNRFALAMNLRMAEPLDGTYSLWVGGLPPTLIASAKLIRLAARGASGHFPVREQPEDYPESDQTDETVPAHVFHPSHDVCCHGAEERQVGADQSESTIANASSIRANSVNAPIHSLRVSIPFIAESP